LLSRRSSERAGQLDAVLSMWMARNVICLHLLWTGAAFSQRASSSFGPMSDMLLDYTPLGLAWLPGSSQIAVLNQETPSVSLFTLNSSAGFVQTGVVPVSTGAVEVVAAPDNSVSPDEFSLLAGDGTRVLIMQKASGAYTEVALDLPTHAQSIAYGDINGDRRTDVLLSGKKRAGITPLLRQPDGRFLRGDLLFPDLSISSLQCVDLNGDGITDIFVVNWLSNQLELFYGIGRGVFSEQVAVPLPGEPDEIAVSPVTSERTVQVAVTIPDQRMVCTFHCSATGEIEPTGSQVFPFPPLHVRYAHINEDHGPDLIVTTSRAAYVVLARAGIPSGPATAFGSGSDIRCEVGDVDDDHRPDLILIDRSSKRLVVYGNANGSGKVVWPPTYGTGLGPRGVAVMDVNNDGLPDILISNAESSTLSVFFNRGNGLFEGQRIIPVSENPASVATVSARFTRDHTVVTAHAAIDKIDIVRVAEDVERSEVSAVPTGPDPYVVLAKRDSLSGNMEMLVRTTNTGDGSQSLSLFQQISGGQLLERNLRPRLAGRITALTVTEYPGSGRYELVFVTYDRATRQSSLSIAFPEQGFDVKTAKSLFSFPDSTGSVHSIVTGYVDSDPYRDLVLVMSPPRNSLGVVYGKEGGAFRDSMEIIRDVRPLKREDVLVKDVDGDGRTDLTWIDTDRKAVVTSYGKGDRTFAGPVVIHAALNATGFAVAGLRIPSAQDLVLLNGRRCAVSIIFDAFRR